MEENRENPKINGEELVRDENGRVVSGVLNPAGRPKGALDFKTKWSIFIDKVAKINNLTPQEIDEQLFAVGYKKAKEGDHRFWGDIHDRLYGKATQKQEITGENGDALQIIIKRTDANEGGEIAPETI